MSLWQAPAWKKTPHPTESGSVNRTRPIILMYHSVQRLASDPWGLRVSPRNFAEHMAILKAHANPIRLDELEQTLESKAPPPRPVVVTFDDGYADNLINALPILRRYTIPATIFVATATLGTQHEFWWDELERIILSTPRLPQQLRLSIEGESRIWQVHTTAKPGLMQRRHLRRWQAWHRPASPRHTALLEIRQLLQRLTPDQRAAALQQLQQQAGLNAHGRATHRPLTIAELQQLAADPLIEIGAHTVTHPQLAALNANDQQREVHQSRTFVQDTLQRPIASFSYPFGGADDYNRDSITAVQQSGFARSCTTIAGCVTAEANRYEYPRYGVLDWEGKEFLQRLQKWLEG